MKPIRYPFLSLIASAFLCFSCQRELENYSPVSVKQNFETAPPVSTDADVIINAGIEGQVFDENGQPLSDAIVTAGAAQAITNQYGVFKISKVSISEQWSFVKVEKQGYFLGSRTVVSRPGSQSFVKIKLLKKELRGSYNAGQSASVKIGSSITLNFEPNAIVDDNGVAYNSKVLVYGTIVNPLADDLSLIMPGDLRGVDADSKNVALRSYGMLGVSLETEAGTHLQLAPGKPAHITSVIPEAMLASAPSEIPLWHFDELTGKWKEEGKAIKKDGQYCGSTPHFSFWNFDVPEDFIYVSLQLRGAKASPVSYTAVKVVDTRNGSYSTVYTDSTGYLRTWVPKSAPIAIQVLNGCGDIILSKNSGPFTSDEEIGTLLIQPDKLMAVEGQVINCEGKPVASGVVSLYSEGLYYSADIIDGAFTILLPDCNTEDNSARLYATDGSTHKKSDWMNIHLNGENINVGQLQACQIESSEFAYAR